MGFFNAMFNQKLGAAHDALTNAIVTHDPIGSTEAQIAEWAHNVDTLASIAASMKTHQDDAQKAVDDLNAQKTRFIAAIKLKQGETPPNAALISKLLSDAEGVNTKLKAALTSLETAKAHADQAVSNHTQAVEKLTTMRESLTAAREEMTNAQQELAAAEEAKRQAEIAANILKGGDSGNSALSVMQQQTKALHEKLMAAEMTSAALSHKPDDDVAAALAAVDAAPPAASDEDRLKALMG